MKTARVKFLYFFRDECYKNALYVCCLRLNEMSMFRWRNWWISGGRPSSCRSHHATQKTEWRCSEHQRTVWITWWNLQSLDRLAVTGTDSCRLSWRLEPCKVKLATPLPTPGCGLHLSPSATSSLISFSLSLSTPRFLPVYTCFSLSHCLSLCFLLAFSPSSPLLHLSVAAPSKPETLFLCQLWSHQGRRDKGGYMTHQLLRQSSGRN